MIRCHILLESWHIAWVNGRICDLSVMLNKRGITRLIEPAVEHRGTHFWVRAIERILLAMTGTSRLCFQRIQNLNICDARISAGVVRYNRLCFDLWWQLTRHRQALLIAHITTLSDNLLNFWGLKVASQLQIIQLVLSSWGIVRLLLHGRSLIIRDLPSILNAVDDRHLDATASTCSWGAWVDRDSAHIHCCRQLGGSPDASSKLAAQFKFIYWLKAFAACDIAVTHILQRLLLDTDLKFAAVFTSDNQRTRLG